MSGELFKYTAVVGLDVIDIANIWRLPGKHAGPSTSVCLPSLRGRDTARVIVLHLQIQILLLLSCRADQRPPKLTVKRSFANWAEQSA